MKPLTRWLIFGIALAVADVIGWIIWHGSKTQATFHTLTLWVLAFIGFKVAHGFGRLDRKIDCMTLRPGRRYHIAGPDGVWVMVGLSTSMDNAGAKAEVLLIDEATYVRRFDPSQTKS